MNRVPGYRIFMIGLVSTLFLSSILSMLSPLASIREEKFKETAASLAGSTYKIKAYRSMYGGMIPVSSGSAFVIKYKGKPWIITCAHVVDGPIEQLILESKGQPYKASVLYLNISADIAIIKASIPMNILDSDDSVVGIGDQVFIIGAPVGMEDSIAFGRVSKLNRKLEVNGYLYYGDLIQVDAAINSGNSGSPLFNESGNVIGIVSAKPPGTDGMGFVIPKDYIFKVIDEHESGKELGKLIKAILSAVKEKLTR